MEELGRTYSVLGIKGKKSLSELAFRLFEYEGSMKALDIDHKKLKRLITKNAEGYKNNPYHNFQHALDTIQMMAWLLKRPHLKSVLSPEYRFIMMVVMLAHDVGHPGNDNSWEIKTNSELARRYNNKSVLENNSLDLLKGYLADPDADVFGTLNARMGSDKVYSIASSLLLATDFAWHNDFLKIMRSVLDKGSIDFNEDETLLACSQSLIKVADISNVAKPFRQARIWGRRVMEEMWNQGDKERELKLDLGPLNDRTGVEFNASQAGFIKFAAYELFKLLHKVESETIDMLEGMLSNQVAYERTAELVKTMKSTP